jgi:hypothetical protein
MRTPTQLELQLWLKHEYDPVARREYYLRTRKLKGRKKKRQQIAVWGESRLHKRPQAKAKPQVQAAPTQSKVTPAQKAWIRRQEAVQKILLERQKAAEQAKSEKQKATEQAKLEKQEAVRLKQRKQLTTQIQSLEGKLKKLEDLIDAKLREEASQARKVLFNARTAAAEAAKPPTAAEKNQAARDNAQYRAQNQQKIKTAAKTSAAAESAPAPASSSASVGARSIKGFAAPIKGSSASSGSSTSAASKKAQDVAHLKTLATKVKGEITVAKQKLAAL